MILTVTASYAGVSPKTYLKSLFDLPHFKILKLIKSQKIFLNQISIVKEDITKVGDIISVPEELAEFKKKPFAGQPKDHKIPIILENEDFLVINKPKNMPVNEESTLTEHLLFLSQKNKSEFVFKPCHRLDKNTTGLLLIAKNLKTLSDLQTKFQDKTITKTYGATCVGIPKKKEARLTSKLTREENRTIVSEEGKEKITRYTFVDSYVEKFVELSNVDIELITGYTHQIRVHFAEMGHPLLGDDMYGNADINKALGVHTQALVAKKLDFEYKNETYSITV